MKIEEISPENQKKICAVLKAVKLDSELNIYEFIVFPNNKLENDESFPVSSSDVASIIHQFISLNVFADSSLEATEMIYNSAHKIKPEQSAIEEQKLQMTILAAQHNNSIFRIINIEKMENWIEKCGAHNDDTLSYFRFENSTFKLKKSDGGFSSLAFPENYDDPFYLFSALVEALNKGTVEKTPAGAWLVVDINKTTIIEHVEKRFRLKKPDWSRWIATTRGNLIKKIENQNFSSFIDISNSRNTNGNIFYTVKLKLPM